MTRFQDGPAQGQTLMLKRAPYFLRVTEEGGKFDALDQLGDAPKPGEKLFAYRITGTPGMVHIRAKKGGGIFTAAEYSLIGIQPSDEQMRDDSKWRAWCESVANGKTAC